MGETVGPSLHRLQVQGVAPLQVLVGDAAEPIGAAESTQGVRASRRRRGQTGDRQETNRPSPLHWPLWHRWSQASGAEPHRGARETGGPRAWWQWRLLILSICNGAMREPVTTTPGVLGPSSPTHVTLPYPSSPCPPRSPSLSPSRQGRAGCRPAPGWAAGTGQSAR